MEKLQRTGATKTKLEVPRESTHLVSIVTELATHRSSAGKGQMLSVTSAINLDMKLSFVRTKTSSKTHMPKSLMKMKMIISLLQLIF